MSGTRLDLGTAKYELTYWPGTGLVSSMAPFSRSPWTSASRTSEAFWETLGLRCAIFCRGAKKDSADSKEGSKEQDAKSSDPCKWISDSISFSQPSSSESCGCGASMDYTVSQIPWSTDWPVSFPLQSAVEFVSASGLQPETIVSRLSQKLGGRIAHCIDSYRIIGAHWSH